MRSNPLSIVAFDCVMANFNEAFFYKSKQASKERLSLDKFFMKSTNTDSHSKNNEDKAIGPKENGLNNCNESNNEEVENEESYSCENSSNEQVGQVENCMIRGISLISNPFMT